MRFLDRSAHSFFQRIVIRSQGVEIERLENYDVMCAMINDMVYSPEQCTQHYWEGFPTHDVQLNTSIGLQKYARGNLAADDAASVVAGSLQNYMVKPNTFECLDNISTLNTLTDPALRSRNELRDEVFKWLC